jgi:hypothetical protein
VKEYVAIYIPVLQDHSVSAFGKTDEMIYVKIKNNHRQIVYFITYYMYGFDVWIKGKSGKYFLIRFSCEQDTTHNMNIDERVKESFRIINTTLTALKQSDFRLEEIVEDRALSASQRGVYAHRDTIIELNSNDSYLLKETQKFFSSCY